MQATSYIRHLLLLIAAICLSQCLFSGKKESSSLSQVSIPNPNPGFLNENTDSIEVVVIYQSGEATAIYQGSNVTGPWQTEVKKEDFDLIITQFSDDGTVLATDQYSYDYTGTSYDVKPKITVSPKALDLYLESEPTLVNIQVFPKDSNQTAEWKSLDESIVTVSPTGIITPLGVGTTKVIASIKNDISDTVTVTVQDTSSDIDTSTIDDTTSNTVEPQLKTQPQDVTVTLGNKAEFSITAEGTNLTYIWQLNGVDIPDSDSSVYVIAQVANADSGSRFRCIISNSIGKDTSATAMLIVTLTIEPPQIITGPQNVTVTEGDKAEFSIIAEGTNLTYQWQKNGFDIPNSGSSIYTIPQTTKADSGSQFRCIISNSLSSDTSAAAILLVTPKIEPPQITDQTQSFSVDEGSSANFSVTATGTNLNYQWQRNGADESGANSNNYQISSTSLNDNGDTFMCIVYNSADTVTSSVITLTVNQLPPDAPANLEAVAVSDITIDLSWIDNSSNEIKFEIERSSTSLTTGFIKIDTVAPDVKSYSDTTLNSGITYYFRVRAINSAGNSGYADAAQATTIKVPVVTTDAVNSKDHIKANVTGTVTNNGGALVSNRGICFGTSPAPTNCISQGSGVGSFAIDLTSLTPITSYYYRAYATNSVGTGYGEDSTFATDWTCGYVYTDSRDGEEYNTVQIDSQCWMSENLNFDTGDSTSSCPGYSGTSTEQISLCTYNKLYSWNAAMNSCPVGWHLPSYEEWEVLVNADEPGGYPPEDLIETGTEHWDIVDDRITNSTGFSWWGAGSWSPTSNYFYDIGIFGYYWSSKEDVFNSAWVIFGSIGGNLLRISWEVDLQTSKYAIRCLVY